MKVTMKNEGVKFDGYYGKWHVFEEFYYLGGHYFMWESEVWGDEAPAIVTDEKGSVLFDEEWNGGQDFRDELDDRAVWGE